MSGVGCPLSNKRKVLRHLFFSPKQKPIPRIYSPIPSKPVQLDNVMTSQHLLTIRERLTRTFIDQYRLNYCPQSCQHWVETFIGGQGWPDVDLKKGRESGEVIRTYLERVLAIAYRVNHAREPYVKSVLSCALYHWYQVNPNNWNWWWNQIGKQRLLGNIALLLDDDLDANWLKRIALDMPKKATMTGANLADLCHGVAIGALLEGNQARLAKAMRQLATTLQTTSDEGIQRDYSYQQHGAQIYNGGYGESFFNVALVWAYACEGSSFQFIDADKQQLLNYFEQGTLWMTYSRQFDFNVCGRSVAKPYLEKRDYHRNLAFQAQRLQSLAPHTRNQLESIRRFYEGFEAYPYQGFKVFWRSDYCSQVSAHYSVTVKANSCRTEPIEQGNQENLKGGWLGFGSMNITVTGKEYHDIFPCWDWRFIPGVTTPAVERAPKVWGSVEQVTHWAGGVSDGRSGVMTFELEKDGCHGLKSWFFFDGLVVALGAGISANSELPLATTLNQCWLEGEVEVGGQLPNSAEWVYHNQCGYISLDHRPINVERSLRSEKWHSINRHLENRDNLKEVLRLTIDHGLCLIMMDTPMPSYRQPLLTEQSVMRATQMSRS